MHIGSSVLILAFVFSHISTFEKKEYIQNLTNINLIKVNGDEKVAKRFFSAIDSSRPPNLIVKVICWSNNRRTLNANSLQSYSKSNYLFFNLPFISKTCEIVNQSIKTKTETSTACFVFRNVRSCTTLLIFIWINNFDLTTPFSVALFLLNKTLRYFTKKIFSIKIRKIKTIKQHWNWFLH